MNFDYLKCGSFCGVSGSRALLALYQHMCFLFRCAEMCEIYCQQFGCMSCCTLLRDATRRCSCSIGDVAIIKSGNALINGERASESGWAGARATGSQWATTH